MGQFDYLFTFYGLLLGIAVANVAIGFADMWRDSGRVRVGLCPPLLAIIVLVGGMNVWLSTWQTRGGVTVGAWQMLAATGVALPYVFVSRAMFPGAEQEAEPSIEDHYLRHRLLILGVLAIPAIVSASSKMLLDGMRYEGWDAVWMGARVVAPVVLMPFRGKVAQRVGLAAFVALLLVGLFR